MKPSAYKAENAEMKYYCLTLKINVCNITQAHFAKVST